MATSRARPPHDPEETKRAMALADRLARAIPTPVVELDFDDPWQLLLATILSAQSTDKTVNRVAPGLFARFGSPAELANADPAEVEDLIHATGFFRNKAKSIMGASRVLVQEHGGTVPQTMAELVKLPGVARKTANVVLLKAFGISEGIAVDVHCGRVSRRLGLTEEKDPKKVERDLMDLYPKARWAGVGQRLVLHGRYVCVARKPRCAHCPVAELCPSREAEPVGRWTARADKQDRVTMTRGEETF